MSAARDDVLAALLAEAGEPTATGAPRSVTHHPGGRLAADEGVRGALFPGSFNPLHRGHRELADATATLLGAPVTYELAVVNVDKPPLDLGEVRRRLAQFEHARWPVALTRAPTFAEKARLFPGVTFLIGWDTAVRLVHARYYGSERAMHDALDEMRALGCRFLVAGRLVEGRFRTLAEADLPAGSGDLFSAVPESLFRVDLSSTELRLER